MSDELAKPELDTLVLPWSGEVVPRDPAACADALRQLRELDRAMRQVAAMLTEVIAEESSRQGSRTLHFEGVTAEIKVASKYDPQLLQELLREAGCPEERIESLIFYDPRVRGTEVTRLAKANPRYAEAVERAKLPSKPSVTVRVP